MTRRTLAALTLGTALALGPLPAAAQDRCRQALALGLDISGSVDRREHAVQRRGLAGALTDPAVVDALLAGGDWPVHLAIYEWSGPSHQTVLLPWRAVTDAAVLAGIAAQIRQAPRPAGDPSTALGAAKRFGGALLAQMPQCPRRTLDLSGDGISNSGPRPGEVRLGQGMRVNGLVIAADARSEDRRMAAVAQLSAYYSAYVIEGPDAFVQTALGFADFQRAMTAKLLRELAVPALSLARP